MKTFPSAVVIADDDEDDIVFLDNCLKLVNPATTVTPVRNGLKLLMLLNSVQPDVVFLDINMPVKNGIECLRELKENKKLVDIRVVVYSTSNNPLEIEQCYNLKANFYFVKPDQQAKLTNTLKALFDNIDFINNVMPSRDKFVLDYVG